MGEAEAVWARLKMKLTFNYIHGIIKLWRGFEEFFLRLGKLPAESITLLMHLLFLWMLRSFHFKLY